MQGLSPKYWYIDGEAYDFTSFKHPGGEYALALAKGNECRSLLESYHLNLPKQSLLDKYKVAAANQPDPRLVKKFAPAQKFTYEDDGFFRTCKAEVREYFRRTGKSHKADFAHVFMFIATALLMFYFSWSMVQYESFWSSLLHGFFRGIMIVQTTHAASHMTMWLNPVWNRWAYRFAIVLIGHWCPTTWDIQHVVAHHVYTNEWPYDSDSGFPIKSIAPNQRRYAYHKYQHIYMWFVYAMFIPVIMLNSIRELIVMKQVTFPIRWHIPGMKYEAWGCTILSIAYLIWPYFFLSFGKAFALTFLSNVVSSLYFSMQFVVNHEVAEIVVEHSNPTQAIDFGAYQMRESLSFAPHSTLALELSGGLNTQVEHHLFPSVHYGHYKEISKIVQRVSAKFGIKYHTQPTWTDAIKGHYQLLKNPPRSLRGKEKLKEIVRSPSATDDDVLAIHHAARSG